MQEIQYNNQKLVRFKEKDAGKNQSEFDGFYRPSDRSDTDESIEGCFFVKVPCDQRELFAEAFAGALLTEFMKRGLVPEEYKSSLIVAQVIRLTNDEPPRYGLIQPMVSFTVLHDIIDTSTVDGKDRSVMKEMLYGPDYYSKLTGLENYCGLSIAMMYSLLLSAHSVHSGNIAVLKRIVALQQKESEIHQFARLDFGDAFRHFAHPKNNKNILCAYECTGLFNYKAYTKKYFFNYQKILGIFPSMAQKAKDLNESLKTKEISLSDIIKSALEILPHDLIDQKTKDEFAKYSFMDSFKNVGLGLKPNENNENNEIFISRMAETLGTRLGLIVQLKDLNENSSDALYRSIANIRPPSFVSIEARESFLSSLEHWGTLLDDSSRVQLIVDATKLDLSQLAGYFNNYLNELVGVADQRNLWQHSSTLTTNIFFKKDKHVTYGRSVHLGHAFVAQYKEGVIFQRLFSLDPQSLDAFRFAPYEEPINEYIKENPESFAAKIYAVATLGQNIFSCLKTIKNIQGSEHKDLFVLDWANVKQLLQDFMDLKREMDEKLNANTALSLESDQDSSSFYALDDVSLSKMSGDQLATICLEELNHFNPNDVNANRLIARILSNDTLWERLKKSIDQDTFGYRKDNPQEKIARLYEWRQLIESVALDVHLKLQEMSAVLEGNVASKLDGLDSKLETIAEQVQQRQNEKQHLQAQLQAQESLCEQLQEEVQLLNQEKIELRQQINTVVQEEENNLLLAARRVKHVQEEYAKKENALYKQLEESRVLCTQKQDLLAALTGQLNDKGQEISRLQEQLQRKEHDLTTQEQMFQDRIAAQTEFEEALTKQQGVQYARTLNMVPVINQLKLLQQKADDLKARKEEKAATAAQQLLANMHQEVEKYIASDQDEASAVAAFKQSSQQFIKGASVELGEHRQKWKYILANLSLAVLLVGVGYVACMYFNKRSHGHYTFFSTTQSQAQLMQLERTVEDQATASIEVK